MEDYDLMNLLLQQNQGNGLQSQMSPEQMAAPGYLQETMPEPPNQFAPIMDIVAPKKKGSYADQYMKKAMESIEQQRKGMKEVEGEFAKLGATPQAPNLAPLLALSDFFGDTKYMKDYESPEALAKKNQKEAAALKLQMQKGYGDISDKELALLRAQMQDQSADERNAIMRKLAGVKEATAAAPAKEVPLKEWEAQSAIYGKRMLQAEDVFNQLQGKGYDRTNLEEGLKAFTQRGPFEQLQSNNLKSQQQAERNFLTAVLRKESGASISPSEFSVGEKMYFPRSGDSKEVLAQKAANRRQYLEGMRVSAGTAWDKVKSVPGAGIEKPPAGTTKEWQGKTFELIGNKWVEVK